MQGVSLQKKVGIGFLLILAVLVFISAMFYTSLAGYQKTEQWVSHTRLILQKLENLSGRLNHAETDQRGYLLTGDASFINDFAGTAKQIRYTVDELQKLTGDNPGQQNRLNALEPVINKRLEWLSKGIALKKQGKVAEMLSVVKGGQGRKYMAQAMAIVAQMEAEEQGLLVERNDRVQKQALKTTFLLLLAGLVVFSILVLVHWIVNHEIKSRLETESLLKHSQNRFALAALGTNDGLWDWNLETNDIYFSPRWKMILGFQDDEIDNRLDEWLNRIHPEDLKQVHQEIEASKAGNTVNFEKEYRMLDKKGEVVWVLTRGAFAFDDHAKPSRLAGSLSDITLRKQAELKLQYEATYDALTSLLSRQPFMEKLDKEIASSRRYQYPLSLCMCDLDKFKHVNDTYGHLAGDTVLTRFSEVVRQQIRDQDVAGRFGGDEFCFFFPHTPAAAVKKTLERIRKAFEEIEFKSNDGTTFKLTCSFGVADFEADCENASALIEIADQALYRAKQSRNAIL